MNTLKSWNAQSFLREPAHTVWDVVVTNLRKAEQGQICRLISPIRVSHHYCLLQMETHQWSLRDEWQRATAQTLPSNGWKTKQKSLRGHGNEPLLTYIRVAEGVLRVRQSARTALGQMVNVQAAEDEQQADQVLVHWIHLSWLFPPPAQINRTQSDRIWRAGAFENSAAVNVPGLWIWLWLWTSAADAFLLAPALPDI